MADLIIKPSSGGSLKLQEDGGTDAISINTSGVATIANATITAGTIGSAVTFNDAHKDIDVDADYFYAALGSAWVSSTAVIDFDDHIILGSNVTHDSAGTFTPSKAGWYLVILTMAQNGNNTTACQAYVQRSGSTLNLPRLYFEPHDEPQYIGKTIAGVVELNGSQTLRAYGQGAFFGDSSTGNEMSCFQALRVGA